MSKHFIITCCIVIIAMLASQCMPSPTLLPHIKCPLQNSTCLTKQAGVLKKYFVDGIPELGNVNLGKILIDTIEINKMGLIYAMKNVEVEGLKDAVIDNISIDMGLKTMRLSLQTSFVINSDYITDGVLFLMPVFGNGRSTIKMNDVKLEMLILFDIEKNDDNNEVMHLTRYSFGFDVVGNVHYLYENAFNNDEIKSAKVHSFLNEYWRTITANYGKHIVEKITDKIFSLIKLYLGSQNLKDIATY